MSPCSRSISWLGLALSSCGASFLARATQVRLALDVSSQKVASSIRRQELSPDAFRASWQSLGFAVNEGNAGTPADDYLDGLFHMARLTLGEARPMNGTVNMATRAERAADFLSVVEPTKDDVVIDLGSGNGKLALIVATSTLAQVIGIEYGHSYVEASRTTSAELGLKNVQFIEADVRDVDLSNGSIFYLYYPFHGAVALAIAEALGALATRRAITLYASGPVAGFGEHFLGQVAAQRLTLTEHRGTWSEVTVLKSVSPQSKRPPSG